LILRKDEKKDVEKGDEKEKRFKSLDPFKIFSLLVLQTLV